jgi:hypothetical protein
MVNARCSCAVRKSVYQDGANSVLTGEGFSECIGTAGGKFRNIRKIFQQGVWDMCGDLNTYPEIAQYRFPNTINEV